MSNLPSADQIRQRVNEAFALVDPERFDPASVTETILLRDGHYYGRAYRSGEFVATLTIDPPQLRLYSNEGRVLREIALEVAAGADPKPAGESFPYRRAA